MPIRSSSVRNLPVRSYFAFLAIGPSIFFCSSRFRPSCVLVGVEKGGKAGGERRVREDNERLLRGR
eukprot:543631-Amorphochlora_amoeboformis.AAC.1